MHRRSLLTLAVTGLAAAIATSASAAPKAPTPKPPPPPPPPPPAPKGGGGGPHVKPFDGNTGGELRRGGGFGFQSGQTRSGVHIPRATLHVRKSGGDGPRL